MNWLDITILCLAGIGLVKGLFDGVIKQVVSLIALVAGIVFCTKVALWLRGYIIDLDWFPMEGVNIISYVLAFLLIVAVLLLAGEIVHRLIEATPLSLINHVIGGAFGLIVMILFLSLCFNFLELIDTGSNLIKVETKIESRFYYSIKEILPTIFPNNLFSIGG
jgi:membrane protein required for colicin V production